MMKKFTVPALLAVAALVLCSADKGAPAYMNPRLTPEERTADLMGRMTLEEKVAQMCQFVGLQHMKKAEKESSPEEVASGHAMGFYPGLHSQHIAQMAREGKIGSFLHVTTAEEANQLQELAMQSRLRIPLIIGIDAIHGNALSYGATVYPTPIGQASSWDTLLVEKLCRQTALEMRAAGMHWTFNPNVEVARDARWGRVGETFGEDPLLVSRMGAVSVRGYQTADWTGTDKVIACAKHYVGGSQPVNGVNGAPFDASERTLREVFLPPFQACVDAGSYSVMCAHNEVNGQPSHSSRWLMHDILRGEMGFKGFIVSDWMDIERLVDHHFVAQDTDAAYALSVSNGMDMHMHGPGFLESVVAAVKQGRIPEARVDEACRLILVAKFRLGLFEKPLVDLKQRDRVVFCPEHRATALEMARKSIVLLKNDGILPLAKDKYKKILVAGPNVDNETVLGDWVVPQPEENTVTVAEGLKQLAPQSDFTVVDFGWNLHKMDPAQVTQAVQAARQSDLAILVVGENSMRWHWNEKTCGENTDRWDIGLFGLQQQLVEQVFATGTPTIVVLVNGRPLGVEWIARNIPAVVEAWEPGSFGGQAVAEVLFGQVNPSGKLPLTVPKHSGQIQMIYNGKFTHGWFNYVEGRNEPLWPFGHGLSYTSFEYSNLRLDTAEMAPGGRIAVSVDVANTGGRPGEEVVQLYTRDEVASVTRPVKELKDFARVALAAGEKRTVNFTLPYHKLIFQQLDMSWGVEPGEFTLMAGPSSEDDKLLKTKFTVK